MKRTIIALLVILFIISITSAQKKAKPKTDKSKISYSIGVSVAKNLKSDGIELDQAQFIQGIKDELNNSKLQMSEEEIKEAITMLQKNLGEKMMKKRQAEAEKNKKEGEAFLNENRKKADVVTLPSGLQYKVITNGNGPKPTADQTVQCHYIGTFIDGTEFDNSYKRGKPAEFPLKQVIKGWSEILQLMPVGSKWQVFIPSELAYGEKGAGSVIGPNETLIFEIELLSIK